MARKTKAGAEATRELLLDAAERMFAEKGVSSTSLNEIAAAAGMTRGAIYWHFTNKVELFEAMHARVELPLEQMEEEILKQADPITALRDYWCRAISKVMDCDHTHRVVDILLRKCEYVQEFEQAAARTRLWMNSSLALMTRAFTEAERKNLLAEGIAPSTAAFAAYSMVIGIIYTWLNQPDVEDVETDIYTALDRLFASFCRPVSSAEPDA